jgi:hypothetical protein
LREPLRKHVKRYYLDVSQTGAQELDLLKLVDPKWRHIYMGELLPHFYYPGNKNIKEQRKNK